MIVPLLHAIVAMLLISAKTLQEHRLLMAKLSKFSHSRSSRSTYLQPEANMSSSSQITFQIPATERIFTATMLDKMIRMRNVASVEAWLGQLSGAFSCVKQRTVRAVKLLGRVRLIVQPEDVDYKVKVKVH